MERNVETRRVSLGRFSKRWPMGFSTGRKPASNLPFLEERTASIRSIVQQTQNTGIQLFMESYDNDLTPSSVQHVIRYCKPVESQKLCDQAHSKKVGTARMNDQVHEQLILPELSATPFSDGVTLNDQAVANNTMTTQRPNTRSGPHSPEYPRSGHDLRTAEGHASTNLSTANFSTEVPTHNLSAEIPAVMPTAPQHERDADPTPERQDDASSRRLPPSIPPAIERQNRSYPIRLTASDLLKHLREKRYGHPEYLDVERRLIYIADPDAYDFSALVHTAPNDQHRALRHALCKYLTLQASIKVAISTGYSIFQLEFHIPYFVIRPCHPGQQFDERKKRPHRGWMNAAFLEHTKTEMPEGTVLGIHQVHVSLTICGSDNKRWTAYCFEDRHFDEDVDDEEGEEEEEDMGEREDEDPVAGTIGQAAVLQDAREYFLRVLLNKMGKVWMEWEELVQYIESGIKHYSWGRCFFSTSRDGMPSDVNSSTATTSVDSILILVGKLLGDIEKTNDVWSRFISDTGDLTYFSDLHSNENIHKTFCELVEIFDDLRDLYGRLKRVEQQCEKRTQALNLRYTSQSNRTAQLTVYFVSPLALVSTFFAIPVPILAFERNFVSFLVAILLYVVILQSLLFFSGGGIGRWPWLGKLSRRARAVWRGDPTLTAKDGFGINRLRRRSTQATFV